MSCICMGCALRPIPLRRVRAHHFHLATRVAQIPLGHDIEERGKLAALPVLTVNVVCDSNYRTTRKNQLILFDTK